MNQKSTKYWRGMVFTSTFLPFFTLSQVCNFCVINNLIYKLNLNICCIRFAHSSDLLIALLQKEDEKFSWGERWSNESQKSQKVRKNKKKFSLSKGQFSWWAIRIRTPDEQIGRMRKSDVWEKNRVYEKNRMYENRKTTCIIFQFMIYEYFLRIRSSLKICVRNENCIIYCIITATVICISRPSINYKILAPHW